MTIPRRVEAIPITRPAGTLAFLTLLTQGPLSRVEVGRRTGLSAAAVTNAVRPLIEGAYLVEDRAPEGAIGRPAAPLSVWADRAYFIGVKVTAQEAIGVVVDLQAKVRAVRTRELRDTGVESVARAIEALVGDLTDQDYQFRSRMRGLGVSLSGDVDPGVGIVRYSPFLDWRNVPFAEIIADRVGLPTTVDNDVRALTRAEQWFGAGNGARSFVMITVGSGIGCGIVVNGSVISGAHGVTGEIGHLTVDAAAPELCRCGNRGCLEAIAAEPAIIRAINDLPDVNVSDPAEAAALAHGGHEGARAVYARAGRAIGLGLAAVVNLVGPERVIISGEGVAAYDLFEQHVRTTFAQHAFSTADQCEIFVCPLGFDEWARGAAAVAIEAFISPGR
jgi:predicted NBD/HSP70 family sugar kinase